MQVEIKGKRADRFRAYAVAPLLRSPNAVDIAARATAGKPPYPQRTKIQYDGEEPLLEGSVSGSSLALSVPKGKEVTRVAFYRGDIEDEVCVGSIEGPITGKVDLEFVEPADPSKPVIMKEGE